jgi:hypothetical protein
MITIVTGRFNNETLETNYAYRKKKGFQCMYCCPTEITSKIPYNEPVFVIEMNNETNLITGIGLIKNSIAKNKYFKVHKDANTNRYTYIGKYFLDREKINEVNSLLVSLLENILFKGKTHSKRGAGLTLIPQKVLDLDICKRMDIKKEIKNIFIYYFREKTSKNNNYDDNNI